MKKIDPFLGAWQLIPHQSQYEFGQPPISGTYRITLNEPGYTFTMNWTTADGEQLAMSYNSIPDGRQYPYENPAIAEAVSMTRVNARQLDSATYKNGRQIAHAVRILSEDGNSMHITQSGQTPEGKLFQNVSVYRRQIDEIL